MSEQKRAFIICPVRGEGSIYRWKALCIRDVLVTEGWEVYYPPSDTDQDSGELEICEQNYNAMCLADVVIVAWDGKSQGCLFDLGMAFALGKEIETIPGAFPPYNETEKAFENFVYLYIAEQAGEKLDQWAKNKQAEKEYNERNLRHGFQAVL